MAGSRILIGGLKLHIVCGHGEGGSCLGGVCQSEIALQHDPLVKDLASLRCVRLNGHNGVLLDLVGDGGASGNGSRALNNRERIRLNGIFGALRLDCYIVCGHDEGGGGAGLVSQCYAACLNDPLEEVLTVRSLCRNGDLNALHGAGDGCACGNGCRAAGDGNGVIPQGGDLGILVALSMAAGAFLMLLTGLIQRCLLIHYPYPGVLGGFGVGGAVRHLADGAVAAVCAVSVVRPRRELVGLHLEIVACCAGLDMRTWVHIYPRLCVGIVGMGDRLIGSGHRHIMAGHGEGVVGCDSNITHPFVELLPGGGGVRSQSNLCAGGNICAVISTAAGHGDGIGLCGSITAVLAHAIFHRMGFRDAVIASGAILGVLVFIKLCIGVGMRMSRRNMESDIDGAYLGFCTDCVLNTQFNIVGINPTRNRERCMSVRTQRGEITRSCLPRVFCSSLPLIADGAKHRRLLNVVVAVIVNVMTIHVKARRDRRECCNAVEGIAGGHIVLSFQTQPAVRLYIFIRPQFGRIGRIAIDGCQKDCRSEGRISDRCHCNRHLISVFGCAIFVRNLAAVGLFANIGRGGGIIISCFTGNRVPSAAILDLPLIVHTMTHCLDKQACGRVLLYGQIARLI